MTRIALDGRGLRSPGSLRSARSARRRLKRESGPFTSAIRIVFMVLYGVPVVWIFITSLKSQGAVQSPGATFLFAPTISAYRSALTNGTLFTAGAQSLIIAVGTTVVTLAVAVPAAYGLARVRGSVPIIALGVLILLQMMPQTATVIPLFQVFGGWGILNTRLAVILADSALLVPFATLLLRPFFRSVPEAIEESASIDGASSFRTFRSIVLPIARNGVATAGTIIFLFAWGEFLYAVNFFLAPGTYPLSALIAQQDSIFSVNWPELMALAVVTSVPILILFVCMYRFLRDGLTVGAVK